jgi:predicted nucleotide-binding protein
VRAPYRKKSDPAYETELTGQARPNVLFEAGMAFGKNANSTVLVELGSVRPFSDVAGRQGVHLDNSRERRHELATKLANAGCDVNLL